MKPGDPAKFRRVEKEEIMWIRNTKQKKKRLQGSIWDGAWTWGCSFCELSHLENNLKDMLDGMEETQTAEILKRGRVNKAQGDDIWQQQKQMRKLLSCRWGGDDISKLQRKWLLVSRSGAPLFALVPSAQETPYQRVYWQIGEISVRSNKNDQGLLELT